MSELTQMAASIGEIKGLVEGIAKKQDEIHKAIYGNGQPGLTQRVTLLESTHAGDDRTKSNRRNNLLNLASLITSTGTLIGIAIHLHWI